MLAAVAQRAGVVRRMKLVTGGTFVVAERALSRLEFMPATRAPDFIWLLNLDRHVEPPSFGPSLSIHQSLSS